MKPEFSLMALEPLPSGDWLSKTEKVLTTAGIHCTKRRLGLLTWSKILQYEGIRYSDGCFVKRLWLAPRRWALSVHAKRIYFEGKNDVIDTRPERTVLEKSRRPESTATTEHAKTQWNLIQVLTEGFQHQLIPVKLDTLDNDLGKSRIIEIGSESFNSPPERLNKLYRRYGFFRTPKGFGISVCPLESVSKNTAEKFVVKLRNTAEQRNVNLKLGFLQSNALLERISKIGESAANVVEGRCILFILPNSKQAPRNKTYSLFETLENIGVPFRRAYANDPLEFSIPDQFPSLLIAAGGLPHRSPTKVADSPIWTIGVDLSHRRERPFSVLALTLVSPDGELVGAWTKKQPRDETARVESVGTLLENCRCRIADYTNNAKVVIFRDGRFFENEDVNLYQNILESAVSLFEFRKRGNPQIIQLAQPWGLASDILAAKLPGELTVFISTIPPKNNKTFMSVSKLTWRSHWNGLGLKPIEIAKIVVASAAAPGLGLHPRNLPAAIYWADGIAGVRIEALRFMGVPVCRLM